MGHLINATALRVGWSINWTDSWYSDHVYYPEFLFMIFRIRFFLIHFFSSKNLEGSAYFYSHFEIINKYNTICVNVFFYDGTTEGILDGLFIDHYLEMRRYNSNPKQRQPKKSFEIWKILIVFNFMQQLDLYKWSLARLRALIKAFNFFQNNKLRFLVFAKTSINRGSASRALFFFYLFVNLKAIIGRKFVKNKIVNNTVLSRFVYTMAWSVWNYILFSQFQLFLSFTFEILTKFTKVQVHFFAITNFAINAKFLSRYMARKLKQGYSVKELLFPMKRELIYVSLVTKYPLSNYFYSMNKQLLFKSNALQYRKGIFKYFIIFLFSIYSKYYFLFYKNVYSWIFFDIFSILIFIKNNYAVDFYKAIYFLSKAYTKNRANLGFLFFAGKPYLGQQFQVLLSGNSRIRLQRRINVAMYLDYLFDDFYSNINIMLINIKNSYFYDLNFFSSNLYLTKLITFNYWQYNYSYLDPKINKRTLRSLIFNRFGHIIGFKLHCLGRFSRKERASSLWFRQNKVPLNTISASLDFGSFTVPLRNSSATVKVWLYKKAEASVFYFKLI